MIETCTIADSDTSGIGGTLSGNALSIAAMRAALEKNVAQNIFDGMIPFYAINNGILMTPFHNMALISPSTTENDVDLHTKVFKDAVKNLVKQ